ncbi:unnamed protein product [Ostreobium quekettii]|uniref:Tetratricopeptide repeat protein n=1 Tax=Ostreobium quekettii TaxID=121088 RepID=A0A8S1IMA3_9CHLO|nr:unnamed protein product [Ostreobium quekettii]
MEASVGEWKLALSRAQQALQDDRKLSDAWALRGRARLETGEPARAMADLFRALEYSPNDRDVLADLARLYGQRQQPHKRLATVHRLIETFPHGEAPVDPLIMEADAYASLGRNEDAAAGLRRAAERWPQDPVLLCRLAEAEAAAGRKLAAVAAVQQALAADGNHLPSQHLLARGDSPSTPASRLTLFIGPVFSREALTAPRRVRFYAVPCLFVATLLGLTLTAWQVLVGSQNVTNPGDLARFGAAAFTLLAPLQLTVCVLFSALLSAAAVSQEKDRKTLILLLLSDLTNSELVVGKLLASMLTVLMVIAASVPFFMLLTLLGGVTYAQVARVTAVTVVAALAAGSLGSTVALWREKTFQALAITGLVIVLWLVGWEFAAAGGLNDVAPQAAAWAAIMSPWQAMQIAVQPAYAEAGVGRSVTSFLIAGGLLVVLLNAVAVVMVRVWNPSREARPTGPDAQSNDDAWITDDPAAADARRLQSHKAPGNPRHVWDNPILWREVRTWAYGKKILVVKLGYLFIFGLAAFGAAVANNADTASGEAAATISTSTTMLAPLFVLSVVLVNALSVTSLTNERDLKALDLLLATDLTPKELIFGKLGGVLYNAKEMILLPMALCVYLWWTGSLGGENLVFLLIGLAVVNAFAAMLGLHAGMMYPNSRQAIGASIGTLLFLFLGVTTCMRMMLALSQSFEYQLAPFLGFMLGGGIALFAALGWRNPSSAMGLACFTAPFAVFYAIVSFLLGNYDWVFAATVATFGFATMAMLVPALSEFDVATGRTTSGDA